MKRLLIITILLLFNAFFTNPIDAASTLVIPVQNFDNTYNIISSNLRYRFFVTCYSNNNFTGSTTQQVWYLATSEETKTFSSGQYPNCKSFKVHGLGIDAPTWSNQMQTTGKYIFQTTMSLSFGYLSESLERVSCEYRSTDGISCYQSSDRGNAPLYLLTTNNWTKSSDVSRWLNYGYKTQVNFGTIASDFEPVDQVGSHNSYGDSSLTTTYAHKLFNLTLTGYGENAYNVTNFTNNTFALFVGDIIDANNYILEVGQAESFAFTVSKGPFMLMHDSALTDLTRNRLLQQIDQHIQALDNSRVVTAVNQTTAAVTGVNNRINDLRTEEAQRQQELMNDDVSQGESDISNFFTGFDDGSDPTLAGIITKPIEFIQSMVNTACTPLNLPLPFVNSNLELPCGRSYVSQFASPLIAIWDIITLGLIAYHIGTDLFVRVHEMKNPDNDGNVKPLEL